MAVTILNEPTSPNVTGTSLVYSLSGSNQTQPQYRYITDIYESGSSTRLTRLFTNKNLSGNTNIDVAPVLSDYLDYDYNWETIGEQNTNHSKNFDIKFGEQYGTSLSSSVTNYTGSASSSLQVFLGNIQYPSISNYDNSTNTRTYSNSSINFNTFPYTSVVGGTTYYLTQQLTNDPNTNQNKGISPYNSNEEGSTLTKAYRAVKPLGHSDYETISYIATSSISYKVHLFNDNNQLVWGTYIAYPDPAGDPELRASIETQNFVDGQTYTIGIGIQNLSASLAYSSITGSLGTAPLSASISSSDQWNYMQVSGPNTPAGDFFLYNEDKGPDVLLNTTTGSRYLASGIFAEQFASLHYPTYCNNEKTRFAFINSFGVWDYYNVYTPTRRVTNIDKQFYEIGNVKLNQSVTNYNVSDRGTTQYFTDYSDQFEITTETVDSQQSQWLKELFTSPEVYIQSGSNFIPINILNTTETISNDTARNKNFQYTITYQYSNNREPR